MGALLVGVGLVGWDVSIVEQHGKNRTVFTWALGLLVCGAMILICAIVHNVIALLRGDRLPPPDDHGAIPSNPRTEEPGASATPFASGLKVVEACAESPITTE